MNRHTIMALLRETFRQWREEDIVRLGASVAYYAVFSLIPLLLISAAIFSVVAGAEQTENRVSQTVNSLFGDEAANAAEDAVEAVNENGGFRSATTLISIITLALASTGMFRQLKSSLNVIWNVPPPTPSKVKNFLRDTAQSFLLALGLGLLLLFVMTGSAASLSALGSLRALKPDLNAVLLWQIGGVILMYFLTTVLFAIIYKYLPDAHIAWRDVWIGAVVTALLFTLGQFGLGLLLDPQRLNTIYGAASALMIVFIWVNVSAHLILIGAEFTQVYANMLGSRIQTAREHAESKTEQSAERSETPLLQSLEQPIEP